MDEVTQDILPPSRLKPPVHLRFLQVLGFSFAGTLLLVSLAFLDKLHVPGVNVAQIYASIAAMAVITIMLMPPVFWSLPRSQMRWSAYVALFPTMIFIIYVGNDVMRAYEKTPQGAKEAAASVKLEAEQAARQKVADSQNALAEKQQAEIKQIARTEAQIKALSEKLEGCFSYLGHRLPALESRVQDSLHNPHAFEHVKTIAIEPDPDGYDVIMEFRAENGFGALRTATVRAKVVPDTCEIREVSDPTEN